jgi:iron complex transport system substrate-binding protein
MRHLRALRRPASRIACLLPSATEIVGGLGLGHRLVAVTHECDVCPGGRDLNDVPRVTHAGGIDPDAMSQGEIDGIIRGSLASGISPYSLLGDALARSRPDLVLTQVCTTTKYWFALSCTTVFALPVLLVGLP